MIFVMMKLINVNLKRHGDESHQWHARIHWINIIMFYRMSDCLFVKHPVKTVWGQYARCDEGCGAVRTAYLS